VLYEKKFNIFENRKRFEKMKKLALLILGVLVGIVLTFTIPTASAHNEDVLLLKIRQLEKRISEFETKKVEVEGKISELERKIEGKVKELIGSKDKGNSECLKELEKRISGFEVRRRKKES
jgi:peptidoglycan hydrolase CwlO-like protein